MEWSTHSRRSLLGLTGAVLTGGCVSNLDNQSSGALPVLVGLSVANDTDQEQEFQVQVQFAADGTTTPETVAEYHGTLGAHEQKELGSDWPKDPGRYSIEISVGGGERYVQDITDRLTQEEQICYHQELAIKKSDVTFPVNLNAPCPD